MKILIKYCEMWNYKPKAASLAAHIKKTLGHPVTIEPGGKGQFDVFVDEKVIFSKHKEGRFPEHDEVTRAMSQGPKPA